METLDVRRAAPVYVELTFEEAEARGQAAVPPR
jgi:hypothetical protein